MVKGSILSLFINSVYIRDITECFCKEGLIITFIFIWLELCS
nr:MAG TPA: hypothetical protein [Caudoviricetes sp.]